MAGRSVRRTRSGTALQSFSATRRGRVALLAGGALVGAVLSGCATASGDPGIAVPTFAAEDSASAQSGSAPIPIALPTDCAQIMDPEQAGALFGQVLGSVSVQSVRGVPEPAVNRTERTACTYRAGGQEQAFGGGGARNSGPVLYQLNIGRYGDTASATRQWQLNANAERSDATASRDITVGTVPGVLIERPDETTLAMVYGVDTLTFILPVAAPGQNRPASETLPDLAQRILPALTPTQPPSARPEPPATPAPGGPVSQAGRPASGAPGAT
ncbi:hypothetical protein Ae168Ps1_5406c [Pseudonocardia sp. Ae168_Ps1]|uniref:hypothetical protein n=1 Tax=unclassified Pseudonocardia TaxID=2619320 RepID=UPI00094B5AC9|nr:MULTISPECIES: hypothetical protein [unclassified Pseudonocardia]OLL70903.1 hypothetical protein Ae168Ps1_5406c [Pseudonocardia sp. Ae168_Ps1]OLL77544.1 hypothetical protein Ae150APs1_5922 [Pseudonocardia sp. Ae150A_Ps1]OLL88343.1 hypothetical protein Ae263Ps1_5398c [Pseudonocardia sp. Ae263_Ps1]OLL91634.1 hypothetical protein Ae356Ps1_1531 [Pseudonocardia sp. Ae356_Ps1]